MWVFAQHGFLSIVEHEDNTELVIVRGRVEGDIENYFPGASVFHTPGYDYAYRALMPKSWVSEVLRKSVLAIDYPRFKPSISHHARSRYYLAVWNVMNRMQQQFAKRISIGNAIPRTVQ